MILGFKTKFDDGTVTEFVEQILNEQKLHSMIEGDRWREGMSIEMATGVRTKHYHQFNRYIPELQTCISTQKIEMEYNLATGKINMRVDGAKLTQNIINAVIKNDGLTKDRFVEWFFKNSNTWRGQIIHWTSLRYTANLKIYQLGNEILFNQQ